MERIVIKVSGEFLNGGSQSIYDVTIAQNFCDNIIKLQQNNQIALVVGAGNFMRGRDYIDWGITRVEADEMGMLFTVANALFIRNILFSNGIETVVMTPIQFPGITEQYNRNIAIRLLKKKKVVIFGGGIGNPFVSTDYLAVQRSIELDASRLLMSKNVDAVYENDPMKNKMAKKYKQVSYAECIKKEIKVCDFSAFVLAKEFDLKMQVYAASDMGKVIDEAKGGTYIANDVESIFY